MTAGMEPSHRNEGRKPLRFEGENMSNEIITTWDRAQEYLDEMMEKLRDTVEVKVGEKFHEQVAIHGEGNVSLDEAVLQGWIIEALREEQEMADSKDRRRRI